MIGTCASSFIMYAKSLKVRACSESLSASAGFGWTSTSSPCAPTALAARHNGTIQRRTPTPCDGSTMIGKCVRSRSTGIADRSSVLRVAVSKVRIPRSHSTTLGLPSDRMYSAADSKSSTLAAMPRLSSTGRSVFPTALSRSKFCMLRAPIWSMSTEADIRWTWSIVITSLTMGTPTARPASANRSIPSQPKPWNEYGAVGDNGFSRGQDLLARFHAARAADDHEVSVADDHVADPHPGGRCRVAAGHFPAVLRGSGSDGRRTVNRDRRCDALARRSRGGIVAADHVQADGDVA